MTTDKKAIIWDLWRSGSPMSEIASEINKPPATVFSYLEYHGGIKPRPRHRSLYALSLSEREDISRGLSSGQSIRSIAAFLGRSPSTISREIKKNGGISKYRAVDADKSAWRRAKRPKTPLLLRNEKLRRIVDKKLSDDWSPEQISGWLSNQYPRNENMQVSHETIYKSLFIQTKGIFKEEMRKHLRTKRKFRHARNHRTASRRTIKDGVSIRERPADIEDRAIPGHWEGDLILGSQNSYIATVVERTTRFTVLVKVKGKSTDIVVPALTRKMQQLPDLLKQSLTWDRGTELAAHAQFSIATDMDVYFCDPSSPWQRPHVSG